MELALGIVLIVLSVALTLAVLFQSAKDGRLSGTIAGGAETFLGKAKGTSLNKDKLLSKLTIVFSVLVVLVTVALVIITN